MKKLIPFFCCLCLLLSAQVAFSEEKEIGVTLTLQRPFELGTVQDAVLGEVYVPEAGGTVVLDATGVSVTAGATITAPTDSEATLQVEGKDPIALSGTQKISYVEVTSNIADLELEVASTPVGTATLEHTSDNTQTISVTAVNSNASNFASASVGGTNSKAPLSIGFTLAVPESAKLGDYSGTVTVDIISL